MQTDTLVDTGEPIYMNEKKRTRGMRFFAFAGRNWSWLLAAWIVLVFMLIVMAIMTVAPFGRNSFSRIDSMHQYVPFFSDLKRKVWDGEGLFYTWNIGMGSNFLSLLLYYMASPLNLIMLFVPRTGIFAAFSLLVTLKISISAATFGYWLSRRRGAPSNNFLITVFSIAFALNNYNIGYYWNVMWLDCIMFLPLAVLGLERIFRGESPKLYIISLFYILYVNYYIAFIICIFLVLWFLTHNMGHVDAPHTGHRFKNVMILIGRHLKNFVMKGVAFAGSSVLAAAMAAFALLPAFLGIMTTSSAGKGFPEFGFYGSIFEMLKQHFALLTPIDVQSFDGGVNVYCGVFAVILFFLYLFSDRIPLKDRIMKLLLIAFFFLSFNTTTLNFIWHGFHDQYGIPNRFSFVYIFTLLTIGYEALMRLRQTGAFRLAMAGSCSIIFYFVCFYKTEMDSVLPFWAVFAITLALVLVYMIFFFVRRQGGLKVRTTSIILACIMFVELIGNASVGFMANDVSNGEYYGEYTEAMQTAKENVDRYAGLNGATFYREDQARPRMIDEATFNGMRSVGTFCSTVGGELVETMGRIGCYTGVNEFLFLGGNPVLNTLIGVRFIYARDVEFAGIASRTTPVYDNDRVQVYENEYVLPIGYGVPSSVQDWVPAAGDRIAAVNRMAKVMSGVGPVYITYAPPLTASGENCSTWVTDNRPHIVNFDKNGEGSMKITVSCEIGSDGNYVMDTRCNGVNRVKFSLNGLKKENDRLETQILDLGNLHAGDQLEFEFEFEDKASDSGTLGIYLSRLDEAAYKEMYEKLSEQPLEVTYVKDGKLDGEITMKENGLLFTSIPYEKGWSVEVDGQKVEPATVGKAFLAVPLTAGHHTVKLRYVSPGFLPGLLVALAAWLVFIFFFVLNIWKKIRKKKKGKKAQKKTDVALHNGQIDI